VRRKEKVLKIKEIFDKEYFDAKCSLDFDTPHQLLVAVQLSAQCTDKRVNIVTKDLFMKYKTVYDFANADLSELEEDIRPCGFYKNKAKNIIASSKDIVEKFGGELPRTMEEMLSLSGVGRKTANLVLGDLFGYPGLVIDTHAIRLTNRFGLTKYKEPYKIEMDLDKIVPDDYKIRFCHQLVFHGRKYCMARNPNCIDCPVKMLCKYYESKDKK